MLGLGSFGNPNVFSVSFWFKPELPEERIYTLLDATHQMDVNWTYQYLGAAAGWCFNHDCVKLSSGVWQHILLTYNNGIQNYYVNGKLAVSSAYRINYSSAPLLYLGNWYQGGRQFAGSIDDLYITMDLQQSADFLPPSEVGATSTNLFGLWKFSEGTGTQTKNSAGTPLNLDQWSWSTRTR